MISFLILMQESLKYDYILSTTLQVTTYGVGTLHMPLVMELNDGTYLL